jgi:hypothetical protein
VVIKKINIKLLMLLMALHSAIHLFGQTGSSGDPYTSLGQAWHVPSSGIYHYNIAGTIFSTYVESGNGWVLAASGSSSTAESSYATTSTLTLQSDAILPSSIYTSVLITDVRMNATSGPNIPFDVQSSNPTVLGNLQNDRTLSFGTNSGNWTGTGTARLARSCAGRNASLSSKIYHACGNAGNMHWQVGQNNDHEKLALTSGSKNDLNLWIKAASVALPIELLNFTVDAINDYQVILDWKTASETNNDFFTIERSKNGFDWENLLEIDGAGNSSTLLSYQSIDPSPYNGVSYYRLKQTDFNGQFEYSQIRSVQIDKSKSTNSSVTIYPNPVANEITIVGNSLELEQVKFFNVLGQDVTNRTEIINNNKSSLVIDLSSLTTGLYYCKTKTTANKVYKQ